MNAKSLFGLLSITAVMCACKKDLEPQVGSGNETATTQSQTPTPDQTAPVAQMTPAVSGQSPAVTMTPAQMTTTQPAKVAAGMNPAHGQPGHRCDIAVGAPLNSPAKTTAQPPMTITPSQSNQAVKITPAGSGTPALLKPPAASAPTATAPGMNPAHGQPGHRCDIAVGAPLSSPPGNAATIKTEPAKADPNKLEITTSEPGK